MKKQNGFTLIEALVGIGILEVGIFAAIFLTNQVAVLNRASDDDLTYLTVRNQILVTITDPRIWVYTLTGPLNPNLSCWLNQDQVPLAPRNCLNKQANLIVYDIKAQPEFDFSEPTAGLTPRGDKCTTFIAPPAVGDPTCPIGVKLSWKAACDPVDPECVNPPIRVDGVFTFNGAKTQMAPPPHRLDFSVIRYLHYCPVQTAGWALQDGGVAPAVTISGSNQVISGNNGQVVSTGFGEMYVAGAPLHLLPCRTVAINYQEDMDTPPPGPMVKADPENTSQICLFDDATNTCRFEVVRKVVGLTNTIFLRANGVDVQRVPDFAGLTNASSLNLRVTRNLVEFLVDNRVYFTWQQKLTFPFRVKFKPPSKSYSPNGLNSIAITTLN